ncbi:DNA alkylation repair protein [Candidatus Daviesbacteria bacterium]|nr:DNA alkylation repair protein [Candidatus Daviesbacteria bacterium]
MLQNILKEIKSKADLKKAKLLSRFFQTGKGEYGEGDKFLGIIVPIQRSIAKKYKDLSFAEIEYLLQSEIHEQRLIALFILRIQYKKADKESKEKIIKLYLKNLKHVNNWDLVDSSAPYLLGDYLLDKKRDILYKLVKSKKLWERRIAVLSTFPFIILDHLNHL